MKPIPLLLITIFANLPADTLFYNFRPFLEISRERDLLLASECPQQPNGARLDYFPDEGTTRMPSKPGTVSLLVSGGYSSWLLMNGDERTFKSFKGIVEVLTPLPTSTWENRYTGMSGAWINTSKKVWGFYHAEDNIGLPNIPGTIIPGFYASIGIAVSTDSGKTWSRRQQLLVSDTVKNTTDPNRSDQGISEPGVVANHEGTYVYILYTNHNRKNWAPVGINAARIPIEGDSLKLNDCKKWNGSSFCSPCNGGFDTTIITGKDIMGVKGDAYHGHPVWCKKLRCYLMPVGAYDYTSGKAVGKGGMYIVASRDLIHWSKPVRLSRDYSVPISGKPMRWNLSIIWTDDKKGEGWLIYGYTKRFPDLDHNGEGAHMVGRRFRVIMKNNTFSPFFQMK